MLVKASLVQPPSLQEIYWEALHGPRTAQGRRAGPDLCCPNVPACFPQED